MNEVSAEQRGALIALAAASFSMHATVTDARNIIGAPIKVVPDKGVDYVYDSWCEWSVGTGSAVL